MNIPEKISNSTIIGLSIMCLLLISCFCTLVYGGKTSDNFIEDVQVECLFETEQEILKNYEINVENITEEVEEVVDIDTNGLENTEQMTVESISSMKVYEFEEEFITNNKLASRTVNAYIGVEGFIWPVPGYTYVSSDYGWRICPFHGHEFHYGIDVPAPEGTPIRACKDGEVVVSEYSSGYGYYMVIKHTDGTQTLYAHMYKVGLPKGTKVSQGEEIGGIGTTGSSTGNHLHFEIWMNASKESRVDPLSKYDIE